MQSNTLTEKPNRAHFTNPGDYCFVSDDTIVMACPFCGHISHLKHTILQKFPLTLAPSVVQGGCGDHFFVGNGFAVKV